MKLSGVKHYLLSISAVCLMSLFQTAHALDSDEITNINVYAKAAPAVVTISVKIDNTPSSGAGTIIDPSGVILTSSHVLGDATSAKVTLDNGETYTATLMAKVGQTEDLAILKVKASHPLPYITLGSSQQSRVGQKVLAIGNPYGFDRTLTTGIISRIDKVRDRIQTDASINPGNSGGPLLNSDGQVIGINQSIFNPNGNRTNIGIGFAVPVDTAKRYIGEVATQPLYPGEHLVHSTTAVNDRAIPEMLNAAFK